MFGKIQAIDIIAIIIIIGGLVLLGMGMDGTVSTILMAVAFYYFGRKINNITKKTDTKNI